MAKAMIRKTPDLKTFTDCMYFINGHCKFNDQCRYRHCQTAASQANSCFKWPKSCRNIQCPYRHPAAPLRTVDKTKTTVSEPLAVHPSPMPPPSQSRQEGLISFFWDIENVPIPKSQKPFDIVQRVRQKLVVDSGLREYSFSCYCNSTTISNDNQLSLFHANVRIAHIPDRKPGAVDRQIMLDLDRFERAHRPPATIVLISGDIDFVGKLSDLRHQAGFHVIVIHNKPAKEELKATVNAHYSWELFTQAPPASISAASSVNSLVQESTRRIPQSYRMNTQNNTGNLRRTDPSPTPKSRTTSTNKQIYECPQCTSDFDSLQALRQHQEAKDHLFDCPVCSETFVTLDGQTQHQKSKNHYAPEYHCGQCSRHFPKLDSLNQHQRSTGHSSLIGFASAIPNAVSREVSPPVILPRTNTTSGSFVQDAAMMVIMQGIEALAQHYPKVFPKK